MEGPTARRGGCHATRWCKTEAGRNEIQQRTRKLPAGLRSILLLVDGQRSDDELQAMMSGLHAPDDALGQLAADGLIERRSGAASMLAAVAATKSNDGASALAMTPPSATTCCIRASPMTSARTSA